MLALLLVLTLAPPPPHAHRATTSPGIQDSSPRALLREIERQGDDTPAAVFEELGKQKTAAALRALIEGIDHLEKGPPLSRAYEAMRHFVGTGAQEKTARSYLEERLGHPVLLARWNAVDPLLAFGPAGIEILWETGLSTKDTYLKARIGKALLPSLRQRGDAEALAFLFATYDTSGANARTDLIDALEGFHGPKLGRALSDGLKDKAVTTDLRYAVVEGLALADSDDLTSALAGALKSEDPRLVHAALEALRRRSDPKAARGLERVARGRDLELRYAALGALAELVPEAERGKWLERLQQGLAANDSGERLLVVHALAGLRSHASIALLIDALREEEDRTVRLQIAAALRTLSGLDLGDQHGPWTRWWADSGASFVLPSTDSALEAEHARQREAWLRSERYDFYGLGIESRRVCFVLDASGSMRAKNEIGLSRLEVAKRQLIGALRRLPDGSLFNVIFFGTRLEVLSKEPLEMSAVERERSIARVQTQGTLGLTAVYDALERAFELEAIDTIYLLSDGHPTGGQIDDEEEIRATVRQWNEERERPITVHGISVGGPRPLLVGLAEDSGGECVEVDVAGAGKER